MSDRSKIRRDSENHYPTYQQIKDVEDGKHTTRFGGYTKDRSYYEGGHGENLTKEEKESSGRAFRKHRGDD